MAKLVYASNMSLDGCTEDEHGAFDWAPPDDDVFALITALGDLALPDTGIILPREHIFLDDPASSLIRSVTRCRSRT